MTIPNATRVILGAALIAFAFPATPAEATHRVEDHYFMGQTCPSAVGVASCSFDTSHHIYGWPADGQTPCAGSAGSYTSCNIFYRCEINGGGGGPVFHGEVGCTSLPPMSCAHVDENLNGGCAFQAVQTTMTVAAGTCVEFAIFSSAATLLGTAPPRSHSWTLCVNGWGPYIDHETGG